jgi:uncharacterized protein
MSFDTALLDIVCCPVTRLPLQLLPANRLQRLNDAIDSQKIKNRGGANVEQRLEQALVTRDGKLAYPVRDGIPVLLEEQGIELLQLAD